MKLRKASERERTCSIDRVEPTGIRGSTSVNASRTARVRLGGSIDWPAALVATQVFVTWELIVAFLYGRSHFVEALPPPGGRLLDKQIGRAHV